MKPRRRTVLILAVVAIVGLAAGVSIAYRRDIDRAFDRISTGSQVIQTRCGPIEYASLGTGTPVLIVHGAGGGFDQVMETAGDLAAAELRVIAMSRFGHLRTPLPADASAPAQADAHACLLDALDIRRAAIVGISAGAPSSLQFALRHPERCAALVLVVPAAYVPRPGGAAPVKAPRWTRFLFDTALRSDFLFWAATRLVRRTMIGAILATPPDVVTSANANEQARVALVLEHILPMSSRRQGLVNDAAVVSTLSRYELESIQAPALAMSTADDRFGTYDAARYTAEQIPGARFVGYASGGQSIQWLKRLKPAWFRQDLTALLHLLQEQRIKPLIAHRFPLTEARRAHELLGAGGITGKIVLVSSGSPVASRAA